MRRRKERLYAGRKRPKPRSTKPDSPAAPKFSRRAPGLSHVERCPPRFPILDHVAACSPAKLRATCVIRCSSGAQNRKSFKGDSVLRGSGLMR